jgi:hypothetical protein
LVYNRQMAEIEFNQEESLDMDLDGRTPQKHEQGLLYLIRKLKLAKTNAQAERVLLIFAIAIFVLAFSVVLLFFIRPKTDGVYKVPPQVMKDIKINR